MMTTMKNSGTEGRKLLPRVTITSNTAAIAHANPPISVSNSTATRSLG
jgi:hypothetical protein